MTLEAKILEVWRKLPQGPNLHVRRASELDVNEASARSSGMPSILVEKSRIFAQAGPSCFGASFRRQSLYSIKRMAMKRTSRAIWFTPLVCVLGCASAPPPDPPQMPMPKAWLADGTIPGTELTYAELGNEYRAKLIEASEPQNDVAHRAFQTCSDYGTKFKIENGDTQSCQTWLTADPAKK
jgi:hypothetical protein